MQDAVLDYGVSGMDTEAGFRNSALLDEQSDDGFGDLLSRPFRGEGFGLPMARPHARFFEGDLNIQSVPDHGT